MKIKWVKTRLFMIINMFCTIFLPEAIFLVNFGFLLISIIEPININQRKFASMLSIFYKTHRNEEGKLIITYNKKAISIAALILGVSCITVGSILILAREPRDIRKSRDASQLGLLTTQVANNLIQKEIMKHVPENVVINTGKELSTFVISNLVKQQIAEKVAINTGKELSTFVISNLIK